MADRKPSIMYQIWWAKSRPIRAKYLHDIMWKRTTQEFKREIKAQK